MAIYGGYAGYGEPDPNATNIGLYETILSGDIGIIGNANDNSYHVVNGSWTDETAIIDGFTVTTVMLVLMAMAAGCTATAKAAKGITLPSQGYLTASLVRIRHATVEGWQIVAMVEGLQILL